MLYAQITIDQVDYDATLNRLFPKIYYHLITTDSPNYFVRLLQRLGEDALPACQMVLRGLSQEDRDALLVLFLQDYAPNLCQALNEALISHPLGRYGRIGTLRGALRRGKILLQAEDIQIDYSGLLREPQVSIMLNRHLGSLGGFAQAAARAAITAAPETLERKGLELLSQPENRRRALALLEPMVTAQGFSLHLGDLEARQGPAPTLPQPRLTAALEEHILQIIASFLRTALKGT